MPSASRRFLPLSLVVALLAGLTFLPGLPGDFVFDDVPNIEYNHDIKLDNLSINGLYEVIAAPQMSGNMRTLPTLTFALDYWRAGGTNDPTTFKTTNILIHAITAFALAWLLRGLLLVAGMPDGRARWLAPALALAWGMHPLLVSSVLYTVQRLQTMGTLFLVLALLAYLQARQAQMEGRPARTGFLVALLLWVLAMACKEDSVQLPIYTLALELTVLRFRTADAELTRRLRLGYMIATLVAAAAFLFWFAPKHWHWDTYGGRDFSTPERLLTQARVLCMYLGQILLPLPGHMPFYYDWLQPSRGLTQPWTTLPALLLVVGLLASALWLRNRQPLYALGVLLFFGGHFVTSNVIGLELAFEHRNHFPLIGALLAAGSFLASTAARLSMPKAAQLSVCVALLALLGTTTLVRAKSWNSALTLARTTAESAPHSARAWISLCAGLFKAGGEAVVGNPRLDEAIDACRAGSELAPGSLNNPALLIVLKTLRGTVDQRDWDLFHQRLETVQMSWDNQRAPKILTYHLEQGVELDRQELLKALATLSKRAPMKASEFAEIGYFILNNMGLPEQAMPYFAKAINASPGNDPFPGYLSAELRKRGRPDLAGEVQQLVLEKAQDAPRSLNPSAK